MDSALPRRRGRWLQYTSYAGGVLLIALGIAVFTNLIPVLARYLPFTTPELGPHFPDQPHGCVVIR